MNPTLIVIMARTRGKFVCHCVCNYFILVFHTFVLTIHVCEFKEQRCENKVLLIQKAGNARSMTEIIILSLFLFNHCHSYIAVHFLKMFLLYVLVLLQESSDVVERSSALPKQTPPHDLAGLSDEDKIKVRCCCCYM